MINIAIPVSEITERDELCSYISDAYKDLYGMRPRFYQWESASLAFLRSEAKS